MNEGALKDSSDIKCINFNINKPPATLLID